jgi:hypothetical protein
MYSDPYTYGYSDVDQDDNISNRVYSSREPVVAGSGPSELPGSTPTDLILRHELPANSVINDGDAASRAAQLQPTCGPGNSSSQPSRRRSSNTRVSVRNPSRHEHTKDATSRNNTTCTRCSPQPASAGLIPVVMEDAAPVPMPRLPTTTMPHYVSSPTTVVTTSRSYPRPSPPAYANGLIPVDENATTPKEPSSDFDAILRNIGPISKKGRGNKSRERSNRYYDRYSSNFG